MTRRINWIQLIGFSLVGVAALLCFPAGGQG